MKKLFLLLILSFFSAQGFAASCPDGSEPTKSISADGTYFVYKCAADSNNTNEIKESETNLIKAIWVLDESATTAKEDYSYIVDPTGTFEKVHKFTTGSECGNIQRDIDWDNMICDMESSDCGENSVRSQLYEDVWDDNRPGDIQPNYQWYNWDVYLPEDFPIQDTGNLLLGEFHNAECPHITFTSLGGIDKGVLHFETTRLWGGDCKAISRIPITSIQDMRGKWTNFLLEIKWENNSSGFANLWLDDKQVLAYKGRTLTVLKENLNYMRIGVYQCCNRAEIKPTMAYFTTPKASMKQKFLKSVPVEVSLDNETIAYTYKTQSTPSSNETTLVETSDDDPTVSKIIEVIQGDKFIVDISEPHELAGTNINLSLRDIDAPDAIRSCPKQLEFGIKVKDIVTQKLADASSIKIKNYRKTSKAVIAQVIVDGKDLGTELIEKGYASDEFGHWQAYFCSALHAVLSGSTFFYTGDFEKSIFWYERALVLDPDGSNNSQATYDLSELYRMKGDTKKFIDYLKQSAKLGYMEAEEALGDAYLYYGLVVVKDSAQAKKWLKKAHEHGSPSAEKIYCGSLPEAQRWSCNF